MAFLIFNFATCSFTTMPLSAIFNKFLASLVVLFSIGFFDIAHDFFLNSFFWASKLFSNLPLTPCWFSFFSNDG